MKSTIPPTAEEVAAYLLRERARREKRNANRAANVVKYRAKARAWAAKNRDKVRAKNERQALKHKAEAERIQQAIATQVEATHPPAPAMKTRMFLVVEVL